MSGLSKKALLVISFGTSVNETREKTIDKIEEDLIKAFPDCRLYRAWTSKMIIRKLKARDGVQIDTVAEALERMLADGVKELIVQPTHVLNGLENESMKAEVLAYQEKFEKIVFGTPLLTSTEDCGDVIEVMMEEYHDLKKHQALVFMGHGTEHYSNFVYAALDYQFKDMGYSNVFMGTVEAYPSFECILKQVRAYGAGEIILAPFMVVSGDHAINDMAGEDEDSWKNQLEAEGFKVRCVLKGLGEYTGIRSLYVKHAKETC